HPLHAPLTHHCVLLPHTDLEPSKSANHTHTHTLSHHDRFTGYKTYQQRQTHAVCLIHTHTHTHTHTLRQSLRGLPLTHTHTLAHNLRDFHQTHKHTNTHTQIQ